VLVTPATTRIVPYKRRVAVAATLELFFLLLLGIGINYLSHYEG